MRTILWDLDGTLADTEALHFRAWRETLATYGVSYSYEEFIAGFGRTNRAVISALMGISPDDPLVAELSLRKEQTYRNLLAESALALLPGTAEWLECFRQAGVRQVISSSGPMANIVATIAKLDIGDYFLSLMSGATLARGKPDPAIFLHSAAAVGAPPADCLVIEDSIHGIEAARRAGMGSIAVGKLATSALLEDRLAVVAGPACLALTRLDGLTWDQCEKLWESANGRHDTL